MAAKTTIKGPLPSSVASPYFRLVSDIIRDAVLIVRGERTATSEEDYWCCIEFLTSERCRRWCEVMGLNWAAIGPQLTQIATEANNVD